MTRVASCSCSRSRSRDRRAPIRRPRYRPRAAAKLHMRPHAARRGRRRTHRSRPPPDTDSVPRPPRRHRRRREPASMRDLRERVSARVNLGYVVDGAALPASRRSARTDDRGRRLRDDPRVRLRRRLPEHARGRHSTRCRRTSPRVPCSPQRTVYEPATPMRRSAGAAHPIATWFDRSGFEPRAAWAELKDFLPRADLAPLRLRAGELYSTARGCCTCTA